MNSIKTLSKLLFSVCFTVLLMFSCENDDDRTTPNDPQGQGPNPTEFAQNFGDNILRTFLGTVVDTDNNPLEGVMITIGDLSAMTDANGVFILADAPVYERFGYVKAEKSGFINASRSVVPSDGTNSIQIMMLPETVAGTTASGTQETISLANGASVSLQGDYIKPDGSEYSGSVNVILHHLDPTDENMPNQMPGMLYAANAQNEERMLETFGMLAVELRGDSGEDLNLAEGSSAEIRVPLDASLLGNAPSTIPLWYFDETHGYWIEDGQASLVGNEYIGNVNHFSFWNCDIPSDVVTLCINLQTEDGAPINNQYVIVESSSFGTRGGYTNADGIVCGLVPSNNILTIRVDELGVCVNISNQEDIGSLNEDTEVTVTVPNSSDLLNETIIGQFQTCSGDPVSQGYVKLNYEGDSFYNFMSDGSIEFNLIRCSDSEDDFQIYAADYINLQETDSINYTFTTPITNIGTIQSCNTVEEFITYQYGDMPPINYAFNINAGIIENGIYVSYSSPDQNSWFNLNINNATQEGSYGNGFLNFFDGIISTTLESEFSGVCNVTTLGEVGDYIDINFSGVIIDWNSPDEVPISGTIHAIRDY